MITAYTDGACFPNPGRGGWGFVVYQDGREIYSDCGGESVTTNNRMEFLGILSALKYLNGETATIYTDSQYCLNCITVWSKKWAANNWRKGKKPDSAPVKNVELIQECLSHFQPGHRLLWVKGHNGNKGNERADTLASLGQRLSRAED
jgi:ribonuclease HI